MAGGLPNDPYGDREWTDDEIYGRSQPPTPGQQAEGFDYPPPGPGPTEYGEEIMQDPWAEQGGGDDGGWFGGDGEW